MHIGKRISELRKRQGITQEQLADILGTTRQAVSKWESGKSNPDLDYVIRMGGIFEVSMDYLLRGAEYTATIPEDSNVNTSRMGISASNRHKMIYVILLAFGIVILLLCPLFATMYRNYISEYAPAVTDPYWYLSQWPLLGVTLLGILSLILGSAGLAWPQLRKTYHQIHSRWEEQ